MAMTSWPTLSAAEVAERRGGQVGRVDAQHGEIGVRVVTDEMRREAAGIGVGDLQGCGLVDDVAVGQR